MSASPTPVRPLGNGAAPGFLAGDGEMAARMRAHDWSASSLGPPDTWPGALRTVVGIMLAANLPMFTAWGPDRAMLYNDGYAGLLGPRHPAALGRSFHEAWPELASTMWPIMDRAYAGQPTAMDDIELVMTRYGYEEETHFSFFYAPIHDEAGAVGGVYCACIETTAKVFAERRTAFRLALEERLRDLSDPAEVMAAAADVLGRHLGVARVGYAEVDAERWATVEREWNAGGLPSIIGRHRLDDYGPARVADMRAGRTDVIADFAADPRLGPSDVAIHHGLGIRAQVVVPLVKGDRLAALLFVHASAPRRWHPEEVGVVEDAADRTWAAVERARAETALRESEARLRVLVTSAGPIVFRAGPDGAILDAPGWEALTGQPPERIRGEGWLDVVHPDDRAGTVALWTAAIAAGTPTRAEYRARRRNGAWRWMLAYVAPVRRPDGAVVEWIGTVTDVHDRRNAETALREREARLLALNADLEHRVAERAGERGQTWLVSPDLLGALGPDARFVSANPAWMVVLGWTEEEVTAVSIFDLLHPDDVERTRGGFELTQRGQPALNFENRYRCKDGSYRWISWVGVPEGGLVYCSGRDITAEKERAEQLAVRTAERDRLWRTARDILVVIDTEGRFLEVNPAWTTILGWTAEEAAGRPVFDFINPDDLTATYDALATAAAGPLPSFENRYCHKDGGWRRISWVAAPEEGRIYAFGRDVTEEKAREDSLAAAHDALRQAQKMEAVGQLTGGVAHDFNNLLTIIRSSTDLLRRPDLAEERRRRYVDAISDTVERAAKLTGQLLAFARRQVLKPEVFDAAERVRGVADMLRSIVGSRVRIVADVVLGDCLVEADATQFDTALVNMAVNARDAMDEEGTLTIRAAASGEVPSNRGGGATSGRFVAVSLTDTGHGIQADRLAQVFEPFFTTKEVGKGTGLGLAQVYGFAKQSGGDIVVESEVGRGTTFTLYLPQVDERQTRIDAPHPPAEVTTEDGRGRRVLLVEDNVEVGQSSTQVLDDLGYETTWVANADEALRLLDGPDGFDVVFSDVVMPGISGIELGQEIWRRYPGLPVVLTSGYSHVLAAEGTHGFDLLHKPYAADELSRILRRVARIRRPPHP